MKRQLFISFTGALRAMERGLVIEPDALFYFGCTEHHALFPGGGVETDERRWYKSGFFNHYRIVEALSEAKADTPPRVVWRQRHEACCFAHLDSLLFAHGYMILSRYDNEPHYSYPEVAGRVQRLDLPLEVIW